MSRNAFAQCERDYNEREERLDIIRDRLKKEKARTKAELEGDVTHYKLIAELHQKNQENAETALLQALKEHDILLAAHKSRIFSAEKRAEKAEHALFNANEQIMKDSECIERIQKAGSASEVEIASLKSELIEAWETAVGWADYASDYFKNKHGYEDDVARLEAARAALNIGKAT